MLLRYLDRAACSTTVRLRLRRTFATVSPSILPFQKPPPPPPGPRLSTVDGLLLSTLDSSTQRTSLGMLIKEFVANTGNILDTTLPYESRPTDSRRPNLTGFNHGVVLVAHCVRDGPENKITLSSGFALDAPSPLKDEVLILTCAHTLEEIRRSPLMLPDSPAFAGLPGTATGSFCIAYDNQQPGNLNMSLHPITRVVSALPRSDLLLLSCQIDKSKYDLPTLPVSPYPVQAGTAIRGHFVALSDPKQQEGWKPWMGGTWSKWVCGRILGYKDFAGREAQPGSYDALSHLFFSPPPTSGSSGGPIIDEESGAVVGVTLGTRMDNPIEGTRGWGVPSEAIFEMFTLPGLEGKKLRH